VYHAENHTDHCPIPVGYEVYEKWLDVAGVSYHKTAVARFIMGNDLRLEFERETGNAKDPNAIKMIGVCGAGRKERRYHVGYLPHEIAAAVVMGRLWGEVQPRLIRTYLNESGAAEIRFQLVGPKERLADYQEFDGEAKPRVHPARTAEKAPTTTAVPSAAPDTPKPAKRTSCATIVVLVIAGLVGLWLLTELLPSKAAGLAIAIQAVAMAL
jgi:hypothetical protein